MDGDGAGAVTQAAQLLARSVHAVALSGAGLSAESGIPTFRGAGGLWTRFGEPTTDGWKRFNADPASWWRDSLEQRNGRGEFAMAMAAAAPNAGHTAMAELEAMGRLAHVITQNVDDLHRQAGTVSLTEIHGNRFLVRCMSCGARERFERISLETLPPRCDECGGVLKNDTVMFGEPIPVDALRRCFHHANRADCFLVVGTSAVVYPAAELPLIAKRRGVPLIEVNPEPTPLTQLADITVRAPAGEALPAILAALALI